MPAIRPLYRRDAVPRWSWYLCWSILATLAVIMPIVQPADVDVPFVVDSLVYAGAWGIPVWIALFTLWSINRYGRIHVTRDQLRVGRHTVPVSDIERDSVLLAARDAPGLWRRIATSAGQIDVEPAGLRTTGAARLLGGAWGTPIGADTVTLVVRGRGPVLVPTPDREGLLAALLEVVTDSG